MWHLSVWCCADVLPSTARGSKAAGRATSPPFTGGCSTSPCGRTTLPSTGRSCGASPLTTRGHIPHRAVVQTRRRRQHFAGDDSRTHHLASPTRDRSTWLISCTASRLIARGRSTSTSTAPGCSNSPRSRAAAPSTARGRSTSPSTALGGITSPSSNEVVISHHAAVRPRCQRQEVARPRH